MINLPETVAFPNPPSGKTEVVDVNRWLQSFNQWFRYIYTQITAKINWILGILGEGPPSYIKLTSPNKTIYYIFIEDDGTLKRSTTIPTVNTDGTVVGSQT